MNKSDFLTKIPESNSEWATQQFLNTFDKKKLNVFLTCLKELDDCLFKSWAKDLTFTEIKEALEYAVELNK